MGRVDLHLHTQASDGTWTPQELVQEALKAQLELIAVTDHESVASVLEAERLAQAAGLKLLRGVEISTTTGAYSFHVLGYGIDVESKLLLELLAHNRALLEKKDTDSIQLLAQEGWPISLEEYQRYSFDHSRGGWKALAYLEDKGLCTGVADFFSRIFTPEHKLGFPVFPSIEEAIKTIHAAGGKAFLAHCASSFHGPGLKQTLAQLEGQRFDGLECYHTSHNAEDTATLVAYCQERGLLISGGSDCHGAFTSRRLGYPAIELEQVRLGDLLS